ncbi:unnamed protein product [Larinioides sclopetarius]|uniref:Cathepsin L n=1 Tax=Larinioides sclopetarius TaxID=280406 RepID=A0AAV2BSZ9_9ARAC
MKFAVFFVLFHIAASHFLPIDEELDKEWIHFKTIFGKSYRNEEEELRRTIWQHTLRDIAMHNIEADLGMHSYRMGINQYSDMMPQELVGNAGEFFNERYPRLGPFWIPFYDDPVPEKLDWRDAGLVTPVKNQEPCGACWAFSATGSLEGQHKKKTGQLVSLSEQNLVDCSTVIVNNGCDGGLMSSAFEYIKTIDGEDTEKSYPYREEQGECEFNPDTVAAKVTGYVELPSGDENALKETVASVGPVSVAIDAGHSSFTSYKSGIYYEPNCSSKQFDHAVVVVGYGTEDGTDYWLLKNSWGESWGMNGYMKMARNKNNMCGVASKASYPLV